MKKRLFAALSALTLTGRLLAAPVSAAVNVPRVYRYYAFGAMKHLLYDSRNNNWYSEAGDALSVTQNDRQQVRFEGQIYTADFANMKVYDANGEEVPVLSGFFVQMQDYARSQLVIAPPDPMGGTPSPDLSKKITKPVYLKSAIENEKNNYFSFDASIAGVEGSYYGSVYLMRDYEKIRADGADADTVTINDADYWRIEMVVQASVSTMECYTGTGDANLDGAFTIADTILTARAAAEDETAKISALGLVLSDLDGDEELTVLDVTESLKALAGTDQ